MRLSFRMRRIPLGALIRLWIFRQRRIHHIPRLRTLDPHVGLRQVEAGIIETPNRDGDDVRAFIEHDYEWRSTVLAKPLMFGHAVGSCDSIVVWQTVRKRECSSINNDCGKIGTATQSLTIATMTVE